LEWNANWETSAKHGKHTKTGREFLTTDFTDFTDAGKTQRRKDAKTQTDEIPLPAVTARLAAHIAGKKAASRLTCRRTAMRSVKRAKRFANASFLFS
jgi:hypothetical protein